MPTETKQNLKTRQPVIVVVGHVDHGKTTLLDYIRKSRVAEREAGGITQSIGAYEIELQSRISADNQQISADKNQRESASDFSAAGRKITFIDTPGHEAFSKMRSRGAEAADVAILVVAADESVKPQTLEAIKTLNEAKTPYVVAINKMDKGGADMERVKADLAANGAHVEGYGGNIPFHGISAKTGEGVDGLLELVSLTAELEHLTYDPDANPKGYILEARMNKNRGVEATVILKDGVLRRGEEIATLSARGKVKILENFLGEAVNEISAGSPAIVLGFEKIPQAGEEFYARAIPAMQEIEKTANGKELQENSLHLILKSSDQGSLEALRDIITHLEGEKPLDIIADGVGEVTDGDVKLAISTDSHLIAFKTKTDKAAARLAETHKIKIISSEIIYELVKAVQDFLADLGKKTSTGELEVLVVFNKEKLNKQLVGGKVIHGSFRNKALFQVKRGEEVVGNGKIQNLQTGKKDAGTVGEGNEAGVIINSQIEIAVGDHLIIQE